MGDKVAEKKNILEMMDDVIAELSDRLQVLTNRLNDAKGNNDNAYDIVRLQKEVDMIEKQVSRAKDERKNAAEMLEKARDKEEKEKIENVLKGVLLVGIMNESVRMSVEREKKKEIREAEKYIAIQRAADKIFRENTFKYVTIDMIQSIADNEEFWDMAISDPHKLEREEEDLKESFRRNMVRTLSLASMDIGGTFEEMEERYVNARIENNGFLQVDKLMDEINDELMDYGKGDPEYEADRKILEEIHKEVKALAQITEKLQAEMVSGESSFKKGYGYTKELIKREQDVCDKIKDFSLNLANNRFLTMEDKKAELIKQYKAEGKDTKEIEERYNTDKLGDQIKRVLKMAGPIERQLKDDIELQKDRDFREKMEMWSVYEKLPKGTRPDIKKVKEFVENENRAWSKLQRMKKVAASNGGIYSDTMAWSLDEANILYEYGKSKKPIHDIDKERIKEAVACLVLKQVIDNEMSKESNGKNVDGTYVKALRQRECYGQETFKQLAKELSESKDFKKAYKEYMKGGKVKQKCIDFLSKDVEKSMALRVGKREKRKPLEVATETKTPEMFLKKG